MSNNRDYYHSSSRTSRNDVYDTKREERLPSLQNVVGRKIQRDRCLSIRLMLVYADAYGTTSSTYTYQDINRSLPPVSQHPSYDRVCTISFA